ncbi:hypothetical protein D3C84_1181280 [compost metagenome]
MRSTSASSSLESGWAGAGLSTTRVPWDLASLAASNTLSSGTSSCSNRVWAPAIMASWRLTMAMSRAPLASVERPMLFSPSSLT